MIGKKKFATQIIEVFFFFAQWWTVIHNSRLVRIRIRHSELFNDGTCTGGWFWIHSRNFSLMTTVNHFVDGCPNLNFLPSFLLHRSSLEVRAQLFHLGLIISTLEIALATIHPDVLVLFECGECPSMQQSGLPLPLGFFVPSLWPPFIPFPLSPLHLESTLLGLKDISFVLLGFPRHASLRESSRIFWTIRNSRFLEVRRTEQHSELIRLSSHVLTWEYLVLSRIFRVVLKNFVSQIHCGARRDNMCLLSPSERVRRRAFLRSFHRNEFLRKVVIEYRIPSFPCNINIIEFAFLPQMFWLFSDPPRALYISSRRSFVQ